MNNLLCYEGKQLSVLTHESLVDTNYIGDVLFCAREVAKILGYSNDRDAILKHVDSMDKIKIKNSNVVNSDFRKIHNTGETFINESGLYSLILSSELKSAKDFKRWVTSEVLPTIRKTGQYSIQQEKSLGSIIEQQLIDIIDSKLNDKIKNFRVQEIEELVKLYRAYGITKKNSILLAHKTIRLKSNPETIINGYLQQLREEELRRHSGQIKAYINDIVKLGFNHQSAWILFTEEVLHKLGYDLYKQRQYLKSNGKANATFLDAAISFNISKECVVLIRRLANKLTKEYNKKTA